MFIKCDVTYSCVQVPPYARAGLYKQLATLKDLVREFREDATKNASLRPVIAANMQQAGLYEDLPYPNPGGGGGGVLTAEEAEELPVEGEVGDPTNPDRFLFCPFSQPLTAVYCILYAVMFRSMPPQKGRARQAGASVVRGLGVCMWRGGFFCGSWRGLSCGRCCELPQLSCL